MVPTKQRNRLISALANTKLNSSEKVILIRKKVVDCFENGVYYERCNKAVFVKTQIEWMLKVSRK